MANNTKKELRNLVIYSVYVRNHSEEGTFAGVEKDLDRYGSCPPIRLERKIKKAVLAVLTQLPTTEA